MLVERFVIEYVNGLFSQLVSEVLPVRSVLCLPLVFIVTFPFFLELSLSLSAALSNCYLFRTDAFVKGITDNVIICIRWCTGDGDKRMARQRAAATSADTSITQGL